MKSRVELTVEDSFLKKVERDDNCIKGVSGGNKRLYLP